MLTGGNFTNCVSCLDSSYSTADTTLSVFPVFATFGAIFALFAILLIAYRNLEAYRRMRGLLRFIGATPALAILGFIGLLPFGLMGLVGYLISQAPPGTGLVVGKWFGITVLGYVFLVLWGLLVVKVRDRFKAHREALDEKQGGA